MRIIGFVIILVIILVGVSFAMLNSQTVHFNYYVGEHDIALSLLLAAALLIGVILGWLVMLSRLFSYRLLIRRLRKRVRTAEQALEDLQQSSAGENV
tara:strand:- start:1189 stop:1479 length:291 start_codon:yes stop_codon:yes gene_type:complete